METGHYREAHALAFQPDSFPKSLSTPNSQFSSSTPSLHPQPSRLWDVETGQELLLQDGHYREAHALAFQPDGALVVTGDYAGVGHVWDLR